MDLGTSEPAVGHQDGLLPPCSLLLRGHSRGWASSDSGSRPLSEMRMLGSGDRKHTDAGAEQGGERSGVSMGLSFPIFKKCRQHYQPLSTVLRGSDNASQGTVENQSPSGHLCFWM